MAFTSVSMAMSLSTTRLGEFAVAREQGVRGPGHRLADQREDLHDLGTQILVGGGDQRDLFVGLGAVAK